MLNAMRILADAVVHLDRAARMAKRQEAAARDQARELRKTHDLLERAAAELGIDVRVTPVDGDTGSEEDPQSWQSETFSTSAR